MASQAELSDPGALKKLRVFAAVKARVNLGFRSGYHEICEEISVLPFGVDEFVIKQGLFWIWVLLVIRGKFKVFIFGCVRFVKIIRRVYLLLENKVSWSICMGEETSDTMNLDLNLGSGKWLGGGEEMASGSNSCRLRASQWNSINLGELGGVNTMQAGEGSVAAEERTNDVPKECEATNGFVEDGVSEDRKDDIEKGVSNDGSFFDCNICFDLAREPVVTCCGHLFCWSCLYRWLHVHSDANECPVCKGEVTIKTLTRYLVVGMILTSREFRGEQNAVVPLDDVDLTPSSTPGTDVASSRIHSWWRRHFRGNSVRRNQEQPPAVDDRDSFSSIAAVINSESQMDTTVEIDSAVSLSASSSRRRNDVLLVSDVDSGDSRARRRRRLS
ncbi:peroxidase 53-like [Hibiscus syriacus]|uniref:E3 ubiquitin-protein ligase RMA n=1 Tax=Hibiscus syriacus TaxID=106335 RepID=A0A6A3CDC5_HIBSY|nr:peroxidase 53-like [Hibiscus syriacus]